MISAQKCALRKQLLLDRKQLSAEKRDWANAQIANAVCAHPAFLRAERVFCYASLPDEVDTRRIIQTARALGKMVALPRCDARLHTMDFFAVQSDDDLQSGAYGIAEPKPYCPIVVPTDRDVCIVPSLLADDNGRRLGYGGGYYDRYLSSYTVTTICICFDLSYSGQIPVDAPDVPMNHIIRF